MNYCNQCGSTVQQLIPEGDNFLRYVCASCGTIHYENPRMIVGCIPFLNDAVLLCKRAIEPRLGFWTLPCGFMENGETPEEGALRETQEEANANVSLMRLFTVYSLPDMNQVHLFFLAHLNDTNFFPGIESSETELFSEEKIPWEDIAFRSVGFTLKQFFRAENHKSGAPIMGNTRKPL